MNESKGNAARERETTEEELVDWYRQKEPQPNEKPSLAVDVVMLAYDRSDGDLKIRLTRRKSHLKEDIWALPGGFVDSYESTDDACLRRVAEEVGVLLNKDHIEQLHISNTLGRDPSEWVVTCNYLAFLPEFPPATIGDDESDGSWFTIEMSELNYIFIMIMKSSEYYFDFGEDYISKNDFRIPLRHSTVIRMAMERIKSKLDYEPNVLRVLGECFTLLDVREVYSKFLGIIPANIKRNRILNAQARFFDEVKPKETMHLRPGQPRKLFELRKRKTLSSMPKKRDEFYACWFIG